MDEIQELQGKRRTDAYSKRAKTLVEKAAEISKQTGAYVFLYIARSV